MKIYDIHQPLPEELSQLPDEKFQVQVREHGFDEIGKSMGLQIKCQKSEIFEKMHRI